MEMIPQTIVVFFLIALNAFFAASEYAIVALRKSRIDELVKRGDFIAKLVLRALENREDVIYTTQIGSTIVGLILGWIGQPIIADLLLSLLFFMPAGVATTIATTVSIVLALGILTFSSVIFGELMPKTVALYHSEMVAFIVIAPLTVLTHAFRPFIRVLHTLNTFLLTRFGLHSGEELPLGYSKEEIRIILEQIQQNGDVKKDGLEMMQNVFSLSEKPIKYIMTPRSEIASIDVNTTLASVLKHINETYSRYPVYKKTLDNIVGFIHVKDVYKLVLATKANQKLSQTTIIRKVINIPETKKADDVLLDMRKKHIHLAAVFDEYGIMVGIVTLEDIIESLVGEIQDEFDLPIKGIRRNPDGSYLVDGNIAVDVIQKRFHLPIRGHGYTTIGGVIFGLLGREPHVGDELEVGHLYFEIRAIEGKRIKLLQLRRQSKKT